VLQLYINIMPGLERLGRVKYQTTFMGNHARDVIRQAARGIGDMPSSLENKNLSVLIAPSCFGGRTGSRGNTAYNNNLLIAHSEFPFLLLLDAAKYSPQRRRGRRENPLQGFEILNPYAATKTDKCP
jgi:hypothetical protein